MPSAVLQHLHERIRVAAAAVAALKKEREKLEAEVAMMQEESRRSRQVLREHRELLAERERLKGRLERLFKKLDSLRADYTERVRMRGPDGKPLVDSDGKPVMPVPDRHFVYHIYDLNPAAGLSGLLPGDFIFVTNKDGTSQVVAREYQMPEFPLGAAWLMIMRGRNAEAEKTLEFLESYIKTLKQ